MNMWKERLKKHHIIIRIDKTWMWQEDSNSPATNDGDLAVPITVELESAQVVHGSQVALFQPWNYT